jgi:hypothetical protein
MNTVPRWKPVRGLEDLQNRLSSLFGPAPVRCAPQHRLVARFRSMHTSFKSNRGKALHDVHP